MQAGRLRHQVTIQQSTPSQNSDGEQVDSWAASLTKEPAEVIEVAGGETVRGIQIEATATHLVRIRFRSSIADGSAEQMRMLWVDRSNRVLGIVYCRDVDGRRRELWLQAKAIK